MKVISAEKKEKSTVELTIQVEAEVFEAAVQAAYLKNRKSINVPGFRKGKATRKIIESMYGTGVFYDDAINEVYPVAYEAAVKEQGLDDVGYPQVEIVEVGPQGMTFKALVPVRPEVKLGEYKGLTAPKAAVAVTEEDVDNELKPFIMRATRVVSVEREAKLNDTTVIDFKGFDNGEAFEGGEGYNYELKLGSGSFVPGFEDQIVGMKAGEEKDLDITFPEDYHADLAGKAVVFHVKVNEVKEPQEPVVDDEFAKDVSEFDTLEAFRADLKAKLVERREAQIENMFQEAIRAQLIDNMECEIPDGMIEVQLDHMMDRYAANLQNQGISLEDYMQMMGMDVATLRATSREGAVRELQTQLALEAVAKAENIEVTDEEIEAEFTNLAEQYKLDVQMVKNAINPADLKKDLMMTRANDLVMANAVVGEAEAKEEAPAKPKRTRKKKVEAEETAAE
jgi:trigger factor